MKTTATGLLILCAVLGPGPSAAAFTCPTPAKAPAALFIEQGVCPGECCTYREWTATSPAVIVAAPRSKRVVGKLARGEQVTAETGEVHVAPLRSCAVRDHTLTSEAQASKALRPGQVFWVLSAVGEGYATLWVEGTLYTEDVACFALSSIGKPAERPGKESCWAKIDAAPGAQRKWYASRWWVRVRTQRGLVGWVDNSDEILDGFDACN